MTSTSTNANGSAVTITRDCSPSSAWRPPTRSMTTAIPASATPQTIVTQEDGSGRPRWLRLPMTRAALSALVTK
ncbi:hypothetical protein BJF88_01690 [Cellulosimicrobium sp. CUA-896]|nr:hypothetical protein BJF88_01690 [Cellulosimicrobium sp. CUA-896]